MSRSKPLYVLAHNIRSIHNVGSIFRTAAFFSVDKLFLSGYSGTPDNPKMAKVSLGSENQLPWEYKKSPLTIIKKLKKDFPTLKIVGLENNLSAPYTKVVLPIQNFKPNSPILLIIGEETTGIEPKLLKLCDIFLEIPRLGPKESLNVSVAFGIAIHQLQSHGQTNRK
jgi:tRNA G18 (ribose-2'-O)-methylase SpoU